MLNQDFANNGFMHLDRLLSFDEVVGLRKVYDTLLEDKKLTAGLRSDLSGNNTKSQAVEKITQIMLPSRIEPRLLQQQVYLKALRWAQNLLGDDMALDFDMLINKAPLTNTETPWHQDAAYWIDLPDKRSVSCWIALDDVYEENGCMWFAPRCDTNLLKHTHSKEGGALTIDVSPKNGRPIPLKAGGCTFHDGFTLHYSKGNSTNGPRRALILNYRPHKMIALEREQGMDHTGKRQFRK
ncbi:Phytanoyl-CoA dioxygenase (PhyH) [Zobellia uliginosa]|uniref:Phytanoyl-CoA dioxygenase (PhyH) n=1 Tax=Zobellia uliginosa TaxID=143224 RepID=A0ABY1L1L6_9FLAO|nr:phytanoyl-CoA dioxygenase family protein [Zobellia uliginosa]SIT11477.1 Phytanoyl-CoA dioxygenase (PhyH) [Zobellia uliginosa]